MYCTIHVYIKKSIKIYACTCDKIYINIETYIKKPQKTEAGSLVCSCHTYRKRSDMQTYITPLTLITQLSG